MLCKWEHVAENFVFIYLFLTRWECGWPYGNPIQISVPVKSMQRHSFNFSFVLNFNLIGKFCVESYIKAGFILKKNGIEMGYVLSAVLCWLLGITFFFVVKYRSRASQITSISNDNFFFVCIGVHLLGVHVALGSLFVGLCTILKFITRFSN